VTIYSYRGYIIIGDRTAYAVLKAPIYKSLFRAKAYIDVMADAKGKENEFIGFPEDLTEKGKKKGAST
jgi:hypothetical protein